MKLGDVIKLSSGKSLPEKKRTSGNHNVYGGNGITGNHNDYFVEKPTIVIGRVGEYCGAVHLTTEKCWITDNALMVTEWYQEVDKQYLVYVLNAMNLHQYAKTVGQPSISQANVYGLDINLPLMEQQQEIVKILNLVSKIIIDRKEELKRLDNLIKARFVELFGDVANSPKHSGVPLGTICSTLSGGTPTTKVPEYYQGDIPWISTPYLGDNHINGKSAKAYITEDAIKNSATHLIPANTIMFGIRVGVGKSSIIDEPMCANQDIVALMGIDTRKYNLLFIKHVLDGYQSHFDSIKKGATILGITTEDLKKVIIPNVDMELQNKFAAFVEQADKSKFVVQRSLDETQKLMNALMRQYFG